MNVSQRLIVLLVLAGSCTGLAQAQNVLPTPATAPSSLESEFQQFRAATEARLQKLEQQLEDKQAVLEQAQKDEAAARSQKAQAQQAVVELKRQLAEQAAVPAVAGQTDVVGELHRVEARQTKLETSIENPAALHYKGLTLTPGGYIAGVTAFRSEATGGGTVTAFAAIPLNSTSQSRLTEFAADGRQSRIGLMVEGKLSHSTLRGYYEADFLGTGTTSSNNQSNSYALRQRALWAQVEMNNGWSVTGGQMWTLATEMRKGMSPFSANVASPITADPNYSAGFVWNRGYEFLVTKKLNQRLYAGASIEGAQTMNVAGRGFPADFLIGSPGLTAGGYNSSANYSFNRAPDVLAKVVYEPGLAHIEVYGIARFFRSRIFPNYAATSPALQAVGAYNESTTGTAFGGSVRAPLFGKRLDAGLKAQWGHGAGRYSGSNLPDITAGTDGRIAPLASLSGLGTLEFHATPRLDVNAYYGGDYVGRKAFVNSLGAPVGYGSRLFNNSGCNTEPLPSSGGFTPGTLANCAGDNRDIQEGTIAAWYQFYKGSAGRLREGVQFSHVQRQTWSGVGGQPVGNDNLFLTAFIYTLP